MILIDLIWIIIMTFVWSHSKDKEKSNKFWSSLKFMHNLIYYLTFGEIAFKCYILKYIFSHYKKSFGQTSDLFNLNYKYDSKNNFNSNRIENNTTRRT